MIRSSGKCELLDEKRGAFFITAINIIGCIIAGNIVQLVPNRCVMHNTHPLNRSGVRSVALNYTNKSCSLVCRWPNELSQCEYSSKIQTTSTTTQSAAADIPSMCLPSLRHNHNYFFRQKWITPTLCYCPSQRRIPPGTLLSTPNPSPAGHKFIYHVHHPLHCKLKYGLFGVFLI